MELKEKILSSYVAFENNLNVNSDIHKIRSQVIVPPKPVSHYTLFETNNARYSHMMTEYLLANFLKQKLNAMLLWILYRVTIQDEFGQQR